MPSGSISPRPQADGLAVRASEALSPRPFSGEGPGVRAASLRPRPNPYIQVALTYIRRPLAALLMCGFTIIVLTSIYSVSRHPWHEGDSLDDHLRVLICTISMGVAVFAGMFATHVKDQFANSRSHLMPHFHRPHIAIAAVATLMLILGVAVPALEGWAMGFRSVGTVAIVVVMSGAVFWSVLLFTNWLIWLFIIVMLVNISEVWRPLALIVSGQFEAQAVGLLALGIAIIILAGIRLCRLNEDMPEYHRRMPTTWTTKGRMTGQNINYDGPWPRMLTDWFRHQAMLHLTRQAQRAERSPWSRICRWQFGMATGWRLWLWAIFPIGFQQFMYVPHRSLTGTPIMLVASSFIFLPTMLAATQSIGWLKLRTCTMSHELMLPVDRRSYVRQFVAGMALGYFQLWGVICIPLVLWWLTVAQLPSSVYLEGVVAVASLFQLWLFGVTIFTWSATSSKLVQIALLLIFGCGPLMLFLRGCDDLHFQLRSGTLPMAFGAAALGVLLTYIAYRRWLAADFD